MQEDLSFFTDKKAQIVVIAPHKKETVRDYWEKEKLAYTGIPDPHGKVGKLYGQEWNLFKLGRMPALFIIDRKGQIAFAQYAGNMGDIPANSELLGVIAGLK
jgi:peroxiredoxin Q/BCP